MKTFITATLAAACLVSAASAAATGAYTVIYGVNTTYSLGDYVTATLACDGFGAYTGSDSSWENATALQIMNEELGIDATTDDLELVGYPMDDTSTLTLTFSSAAYQAGDEVTIYLILNYGSISVEGLTDTSVSSAANGTDSGFSTVSASSSGKYHADEGATYLFRLAGALSGATDEDGNYTVTIQLNGAPYIGLVAVSGTADAVPEPATATLSLLALAALAARRRRN